MTQTIAVDSLRVEAASGKTLYAGESGFSSVWAEILSDNSAQTEELSRVASDGQVVTFRCGKLSVTGNLTNRGHQDQGTLFVVRIDSLDYGVPEQKATLLG